MDVHHVNGDDGVTYDAGRKTTGLIILELKVLEGSAREILID